MTVDLLSDALRYHQAGFLPLPTDGVNKFPATQREKIKWKQYQTRHITAEEVMALFPDAGGIGLICGKANPDDPLGLCVIDVDTKNDPGGTIWGDLQTVLMDAAPTIWEKLSTCIVRTPSGGYHLHYLCAEVGSKERFAGGCVELLENGSFCVFPPTPGYSIEKGEGIDIDEITPEEQEILKRILRSLRPENEKPAAVDQPEQREVFSGGTDAEVWDLFNERNDGQDILRRNGWKLVKSRNPRVYYLRPGGSKAETSGNWDTDRRLFYCFSSSSPLPPEKGLTAFALFAHLEHGKDFKAAARAARLLYPEAGKNPSRKTLPKATGTPQERRSTPLMGEGGGARGDTPEKPETGEEFRARMGVFLQRRRLTELSPVMEPVPIISAGGSVISTPGNITVIGGQAKSGKTAVMAAWIAASLADPLRKPETFGATIVSSYGTGKAVIHIDTEQSEWDQVRLLKRIHRYSHLPKLPDSFYSISLRGCSASESREAIEDLLGFAKEDHGGIHSIWVDGVGDLLNDTNDLQESVDAVKQMERWVAQYNCPLFAIIHHNPGSESTKGRGHLGSTLERKAESVLSVKKDADRDVSTIAGDKLRNAGKLPPMAFGWDEDGVPHTRDGAELKRERDIEKYLESIDAITRAVVADGAGLRHKDLKAALISEGLAEATAKTHIRKLKELGVLVQNGEIYTISKG